MWTWFQHYLQHFQIFIQLGCPKIVIADLTKYLSIASLGWRKQQLLHDVVATCVTPIDIFCMQHAVLHRVSPPFNGISFAVTFPLLIVLKYYKSFMLTMSQLCFGIITYLFKYFFLFSVKPHLLNCLNSWLKLQVVGHKPSILNQVLSIIIYLIMLLFPGDCSAYINRTSCLHAYSMYGCVRSTSTGKCIGPLNAGLVKANDIREASLSR